MAAVNTEAKHPSTYNTEEHIVVSHLRKLISGYYIDRTTNELLTKEQYENRTEQERASFVPMTQRDLATVTGLRPNVITELGSLQRSTINLYQISAIAKALGISDISRIISFKPFLPHQ